MFKKEKTSPEWKKEKEVETSRQDTCSSLFKEKHRLKEQAPVKKFFNYD